MRSRMVVFGLAALALVAFGCGGGSDNPGGPDDTPEYVHIQSVYPPTGTYGLGDTVTVSIVFDTPVDSVGAILVPTLRGLGGDGGFQQWLLRSDDKLTFSRKVSLDPNTAYQLLVVWALGVDSTALDEAEMVSFSTMAEMPTGSISGHITTPSAFDPVGAVLVLVDAYRWVGWQEQESEDYIMALGVVGERGGDYRIESLAPGKYKLYAFRYAIEDGKINEDESLFGYYTEEGSMALGVIDVRNNQETDGVDFLMSGQSIFDD